MTDALRKRLIYQSWYRGCKETDILLGRFARERLPGYGEAQLLAFEELLKEEDWDLYNWLLEKIPAPEHVAGNVVYREIKTYWQEKYS